MLRVKQSDLAKLVPAGEYTAADVAKLKKVLTRLGTLKIFPNRQGLYSAIGKSAGNARSRYRAVWLRDNVMIANYFIEIGEFTKAKKIAKAITKYLKKYRYRFEDVIFGKADKENPMNRPHVRFDGENLSELSERWPHDQNDALGYFLWLRFRLVNLGKYSLTAADEELFNLFPKYFQAIEYWQDADSGHWEENREVRNSSIGAVAAGLEEMKQLFENTKKNGLSNLDFLITQGRKSLKALPAESKTRDADAALLFLIYPLQFLNANAEEAILQRILRKLMGDIGIKRYIGDSYWAPEYKKKLSESDRTRDWSEDIAARNAFIPPEKRGKVEAEWCMFDSIVSIIYGRRYLNNRREEDRKLQTAYFNRALAQITPTGQIPEAYYIEDESKGEYIPNDHIPLAWAQANLGVAFEYMRRSH